MASLNKVQIIGRLGKDPELRQTQNKVPVLNMTLATKETYGKEGQEKKETTEWHTIIVWGNTAENCHRFLKKGSLVFIEGRLQTRQWEKDGQKHYSTEIVANNVQFLDSKAASADQKPRTPVIDTDTDLDLSEIPF